MWATWTRKPSTPRSNQNRRGMHEVGTDLRMGPVEVGLLDGEVVQVPLAGG
jgi:hypothetical protein